MEEQKSVSEIIHNMDIGGLVIEDCQNFENLKEA